MFIWFNDASRTYPSARMLFDQIHVLRHKPQKKKHLSASRRLVKCYLLIEYYY
jgi:hypothetical protein